MIMDSVQSSQCRRQANLFALASQKNIDGRIFINFFMNSDVARRFDLPYSSAQWRGHEYLMDELSDEYREKFGKDFPKGNAIDEDAMGWIGKFSRYWHFYKNVSSAEINKIADADRMLLIYPGYHTLDWRMAVDRVYEADEGRKKRDCALIRP